MNPTQNAYNFTQGSLPIPTNVLPNESLLTQQQQQYSTQSFQSPSDISRQLALHQQNTNDNQGHVQTTIYSICIRAGLVTNK